MTSAIRFCCQQLSFIFQPIAEPIKNIGQCVTQVFKKAIEQPAGYFLKICVFREAALQDRCFQWVTGPLARGITNLWMRCQGIPTLLKAIDLEYLQESSQFLAEFAEVKSIQTPDGTTLQWALYTPEKFQQWITRNGGVRDGEWIRPRDPEDWKTLQRLRKFKWFKEEGQAFQVPALKEEAGEKCVLRCQGFGRTMSMDKAFIGMHLAAGFNYAIFDWRKEISAKGVFQDAETIYQALLNAGFTHKQIKPMGSCRATFVIAHLKEQYHHEGLEVVMVQTPPSLRATVAHAMWPANQIGLMGIGSIEKEGAHFDTLCRFKSLDFRLARTCLIMSEGDQTIPQHEADKLVKAVHRAGPCTLIIEPKAGQHDPHFSEPLRNPYILQQYFKFLTS